MKKIYLSTAVILVFLITSLSSYSTTYYSIANSNWTSPATWSTVACAGAASLTAPGVGDNVIICVGTTVTMDGVGVSCNSLTINGTANWAAATTTNVGVGGITINIGGDITGAFAGILTTKGGLALNATLTSTLVTIKTITTAGQLIFGTGTLAKLDISANTTNTGNITVTTTLANSIASTLTQGASATLSYGGTTISPTLDASAIGNTVNYSGVAQNIKTATYWNLTASGSNYKSLTGNITVNGNLTVKAGVGFATWQYQLTGNATGIFTLEANSYFVLGSIGSSTVGTFPTNFTKANISFSPTSTFYYNSNSTQTVSSVPDYGNLWMQQFSGSKSADGDINVTGNLQTQAPTTLSMTTHTLNLTGSHQNTGGLSFTSGIFNIAGNWTNTGAFTCGTGTVNYNGAGTQTVRGINYTNLTFSNTGTKILQASATIGIAGDFARGTMTVTPGATNTVLFNGAAQNMTGNATTFTNLTINNTSLTINGDITVKSTLTFTAGAIITAANTVIIPATGTVSRTSGHVVGNLRKNVTTGSNVSRTFEIGTGTDYTPLDILFTSVSVAGNLTASTTSGDHPQIASSGFNASKTVNRYWTITNSAIVYTNYNATCNFVNTDKDPGLITSNSIVKIYDGATWSSPGVGTQGANATEATSVATPATPNTVYLQIGEASTPSLTGNLYSIATGNWSTAGTWSTTTPGGLSCGCIPTSLDDVIIENGYTVTMDGNAGAAKSLTIQTGGIALWTSALTTNIGTGGINITATGDITGSGAGLLTNKGNLILNNSLTNTAFTLQMTLGSAQTISGTGTLAKLDISSNTINNGNLTVTTTLSGASTLTQGASATLSYAGSTAISPTLDASTVGNTVNYNGAAQTVKSATYHHLIISGSGYKSLSSNITVNGNLTVKAGVGFATFQYQLTGNATGIFTLEANSSFVLGYISYSTVGTFPTNFTKANISFSPTSTFYYNSNSTQTVSSVPDYGNLWMQQFSGSKSADGDINVTGNLQTQAPTTLSMTTHTLNLTGSHKNTGGLSFTSGIFNIAGNWTNTGAFTCGTGTVTFNGSAAQTISGSATKTFYDLTINNAAGVNKTSTAVAVTDVLTVAAGNLGNSSGTFTLKSDATKYARIAPVGPTGSFSGKFTIEKYLPGRATSAWSDVSSPVSNSTIQDWDNELWFSYPNNPPSVWSNVLAYDETVADFVGVTPATATSAGKGFHITFQDSISTTSFTATTLTSVGTPNIGPVTIPVTYTNTLALTGSTGSHGSNTSDTTKFDGENLVGNPFASALDLSKITVVGSILNYVDIYDAPGGSYSSYPLASTIISPHQGFWAYTAGNASATIQVPESAKSTINTLNIKSVIKTLPFLQLTISSADGSNELSHTLKIACAADANDGWDLKDHPFRKSPNELAPSITAFAGNRPLSISTFNNSHEEYTMPLNVQVGITGKYQINTKGIEFVNTDYSCVTLEDNVSHQFTDLNSTTNYTFFATPTDSKDRFALHFSKSGNCKSMISSTAISNLDNQIQVLPNEFGNTINFNFDETVNTNISVTSILGQKIIDNINVEAATKSLNITLPEGFHGLYIIKIQSEKGEIVKKFVKP